MFSRANAQSPKFDVGGKTLSLLLSPGRRRRRSLAAPIPQIPIRPIQTAFLSPTRPLNNNNKNIRYTTLKKPKWNPPNKLFGPVWGVLYVSMGAASWAVSRVAKANRGAAVALYAAQLAFNVSGSWGM